MISTGFLLGTGRGVLVLSLSEAEPFKEYTVKWCLTGGYDDMLSGYGIVCGARLRVLSRENDGVIVRINNTRLALSRGIAERIKI